MEIQFLGTGAGIPSKFRNVSSLALRLHDEINEVWLFDCGEATQHQILHTTIRPKKIANIFITHMHGDHIFGLPGLLSSRSFQGGETPLNIYGPPGIKEYIQANLRLTKSRLTYPIHIDELNPKGGELTTSSGWLVKYLPLQHGVLSLGYRIEQPDKPGELLIDQLAKYSIPNGPIYGQLKRGEIVTLADGTQLDGRDFIAPDQKGKIITILGDTRLCDNSRILAKDADVLVHEATHSGEEGQMAYAYYHSTNIHAAQVAKEANVKLLLLNHISPRYTNQDIREILAETRKVFQETYIAADLKEFDIPMASGLAGDSM